MKQKFSILILLLGLLFLSACNGAQNSNQLIVSGFVSAREMRVAPEIGGAVAEVLVKEGENVTAGQTLFRMKEDVAQAQLAQAEAGVEAAQAAVAAAEAQFAAAQVQYAA
ncbi:MAG TPA: biotin/lipoyl-binding protein, partial [Anaerolineaceae bacterium]|nr:biotin/lipoyl-binding protein [Anaerolineaceae bacterium]